LGTEERIEIGLVGGEVRPEDELAAIKRKWKTPRPEGNRW
jgi:hypothetical protein